MRFSAEDRTSIKARDRLVIAAATSIEMMESRILFSAFTGGDVAVVRVVAPGSGSTIADVGTPVFIDEYTPTGTLVQSIAMPTAASGSNDPFLLGNNNSEGLLNLSTDGRELLLAGYDTTVGGMVDTASSSAVPRVIGEVTTAGVVNTSTAVTDAANGANVRGVAGSNATGFWIAGQDNTKAGGGVRYVSGLGATTSTDLIGSSVPNGRGVEIWNGQLYFTQDKVSSSPVVETLNTSAGSLQSPTTIATVNPLPGSAIANLIPSGSQSKTGQFVFAKVGTSADFQINGADSGYNTLYVADVATTATGASPGITKYAWTGTNWAVDGTIGSTTLNFEGITASVSGSTVTMYASVVNPTSSTTAIVSIVDNSGFNGTFSNNGSATPTTIATAPAGGTAYRGISFVPTVASAPTPTVSSVAVTPTAIIAGTTISLSAVVTESGGGSASSVSFYRETTNGTENVAVDALVPGTATNSGGTWTLSSVSTTGQAVGTYNYYAVATDGTNGTNSGFGNAPRASLNVIQAAPTVTIQPISQTIVAGESVTFTAATTGNPTPTVQWKISSDGGNTFTNIPAATTTTSGVTTTTTYTITSATEGISGDKFEVVFTNNVPGTATTTPATLTVQGTPITQWNFTGGEAPPPAGSTTQGTGNSPFSTFGSLSDSAGTLGLNNDYTGVQAFPESDILIEHSTVNPNISEYDWRIRSGNGLGPTGSPGTPEGWSQNAPEDAQGVLFKVNTIGYANITLHYDWNQGGISDILAQYSPDGGTTWVNAPGSTLEPDGISYYTTQANGKDFYGITPTGAPTGITVNLQGVTAANNNSNFQLRLVAAYSPTLPQISDGNLVDPIVHGQYATGAPGAVNAQQVIQFDSGVNGGTFTLTYNGQATAPIAYSAIPATLIANITAALSPLVGAANFTVTQTNYSGTTLLQPLRDELGQQNDDMTVTFIEAQAAMPVTTMTSSSSLTGGSVSVATWVNGSTNGLSPYVDGGGAWQLGNISFNGDSVAAGGLAVTGNPLPTSIASGNTATFTASAYCETSPVTAQWQVNTGSSWSNIGGATNISGTGPGYTSTYSFTTTTGQTGNQYRCVFTQGASSVNSQGAVLTVVAPATPVVTLPPANLSVQAGNVSVFAATASGAPTPDVQWQISTNNGSTWTNLTNSATISGATTTTLSYTTLADASESGDEFRAVFSNGVPTLGTMVNSAAATMTVLLAETNITNWDFNLYPTSDGSDGKAASPLGYTNNPAPTGGIVDMGTATPLGMTLAYNPLDSATGTAPPGAVPASDITNSPGQANLAFNENTWRIRGGTTPTTGGTPANGWSNFVPEYTQGAQFSVPTTGYNKIYVTMDWYGTTSGELNAQEQYTIDGTHWININNELQVFSNDFYGATPAGGPIPLVIDVSHIAGAANNPNFGVRLVNAYNVILSNVQTLELPDTNSFTLSDGAHTTPTIPYSSTIATEATNIQTALANLADIGAANVSVLGFRGDDGNPTFTVTFGGSLTSIVPTLVSSDTTDNQNITHPLLYGNGVLVGTPPGPAPYQGGKGNWRFDNIEVHGVSVATAPAVASTQVNNGSAQRSNVDSFRVVFNEPVNFTASSFTLSYETVADNQAVQNSGGSLLPIYAALSNTNDINFSSPDGGITWIFSPKLGGAVDRTAGAGDFNGLGIFANGLYSLNLHGASITDLTTGTSHFNSGADQVAQFADGTGTLHHQFSALFGDIAGTANVTTNDNKAFSKAFLQSFGNANYNGAFDLAGMNNSINTNDNKAFSKNFLVSLLLS